MQGEKAKQNRKKKSVNLDKLTYGEIISKCPNINLIKRDHQAAISHIPLGASVLKYIVSDHCCSKRLWRKIVRHTLLSFGCAEVWNENQK